MTLDERIDFELKNNPELKKVFDENPEKRELYKRKILDSENQQFGVVRPNPEFCRTCQFSKGVPPFADSPEKAYCEIYTKKLGIAKPKNVYFEGKRCKYYRKDDS